MHAKVETNVNGSLKQRNKKKMSQEVYLTEMDVRRLEMLQTTIEQLTETIEKLNKTITASNQLTANEQFYKELSKNRVQEKNCVQNRAMIDNTPSIVVYYGEKKILINEEQLKSLIIDNFF